MSGGRTHGSGPLIIGHRGASYRAPENTLAAFGLALHGGADGLEFDVRLASDGVPVVFHDATFERTVGIYGRVESYPSTVLSKMHAGEWFNFRYPARAREFFADEHIPTLAQVFEGYGALLLYAELKCEEPSRRAPLARAVVELTRAHGLEARVVVKSFAHDSLAEVKRLAPEIRTAALFGRTWPHPFVPADRIIADAVRCGADEISLHHSLLRPATVGAARARGLDVLVWTVDTPFWLRRAIAFDLKAVITNRPAEMCAALRRLRGPDAPRREAV